jgi:single-strand DNA-binding protein
MPSRCLNKVILIGNLTRDPELRYTPGGMAVVSFGIATNRVWVTKQGEKKEDAQFHRIVAWNKLAELCSQLLSKGRRVYVEGRIQYRDITDSAGVQKQISEIVIEDMIVLDNKGSGNYAPKEEEEANLELNNGAIEDIVIPDDIGLETDTTETATMETSVTETPVAEETSASEESSVAEETPVVEETPAQEENQSI